MASKGVRLCTCAAEAVLARTLRRATSNQLKGHVGRTSIAPTWKVRNGFTHMDTHTHTKHHTHTHAVILNECLTCLIGDAISGDAFHH